MTARSHERPGGAPITGSRIQSVRHRRRPARLAQGRTSGRTRSPQRLGQAADFQLKETPIKVITQRLCRGIASQFDNPAPEGRPSLAQTFSAATIALFSIRLLDAEGRLFMAPSLAHSDSINSPVNASACSVVGQFRDAGDKRLNHQVSLRPSISDISFVYLRGLGG